MAGSSTLAALKHCEFGFFQLSHAEIAEHSVTEHGGQRTGRAGNPGTF